MWPSHITLVHLLDSHAINLERNVHYMSELHGNIAWVSFDKKYIGTMAGHILVFLQFDGVMQKGCGDQNWQKSKIW